jgi:PAS domain S-box-containing protein
LIHEVNPGYTQLTGYGREELVGKRVAGLGIVAEPSSSERLTLAALENARSP